MSLNEAGTARLDLGPLLNPRAVGIVGVSARRTRGTKALENLLAAGFEGRVYPISPNYDSLAGLRCYPSVAELPEPLDSLLVAIPAETVPATLAEAHRCGTRSAVVLSSGFAEAGPDGEERDQQLRQLVGAGLPICGPNCFGLIDFAGRAAMFSGSLPRPLELGGIAVVSQSGGFANLIANTLIEDRGLGFRYLVSCGNQIGPTIEDYLEYLVAHPAVRVVACYVEQVRSAPRLLEIGSAAMESGTTIVMLKSGRSASAKAAIASHTGSVAGSAEVADAVLAKAGIVAAASLDELVEITAIAAVGDPARIGRRVLVVSGGGGETSHAADAADRAGVVLPPLQPGTREALTAALPGYATASNPLDMTGTVFEKPDLFPAVLHAVIADQTIDVVAINLGLRALRPDQPRRDGFISTITAVPDAARTKIIAYGPSMTGEVDRETIALLAQQGVPSLLGTDSTMQAIAKIAAHNEQREIRDWTRDLLAAGQPPGRGPVPGGPMPAVPAWPGHASELTLPAGWQLLTDLGVPLIATREAPDRNAAVAAADDLGYPVAVKVASLRVSHKSDIGGVALNLHTPAEVSSAFDEIQHNMRRHFGEEMPLAVQRMAAPGLELLAGIVRDSTLGPAVVIGLGGVYVEILDDTAVDIPPITTQEAMVLLRRLRGYPLLDGARGREPVDLGATAELLVILGRLAATLPDYVRAIDLNPVVVHPNGLGISCVDLWIDTPGE